MMETAHGPMDLERKWGFLDLQPSGPPSLPKIRTTSPIDRRQEETDMKTLPGHHTKIVCTIGPASDSLPTLRDMIKNGMNVARLNLAHGTPEEHRARILRIREASRSTGRRVLILADLPGPKIRIGTLSAPITLRRGERLLLSPQGQQKETGEMVAIPLDLPPLLRPLRRGDRIILSDGTLSLRVEEAKEEALLCRVVTGGVLVSRKGVNLPGLMTREGAFTSSDRSLLSFVLDAGAEAVSVSFVTSADDVEAVRQESRRQGHDPFIVAKIERRQALKNIDAILDRADGIMVARGDLGVEVPLERIALYQKELIRKAVAAGKPVITATQMLESMVHNPKPTRAEVTDVSNAIIDGTDAIMLSEESAIGDHPVAAVAMLSRIARVTESHPTAGHTALDDPSRTSFPVEEVVAYGVRTAVKTLDPLLVVTPTESGRTASRIARFRLSPWILALCPQEQVCQRLCLTRGVWPVKVEGEGDSWEKTARSLLKKEGVEKGLIVLTRGPGPKTPGESNQLEIIRLDASGSG